MTFAVSFELISIGGSRMKKKTVLFYELFDLLFISMDNVSNHFFIIYFLSNFSKNKTNICRVKLHSVKEK